MPGFNVDVPHSLGKDAAKEKLHSFMDKVREKYQDQVSNLEENWEGDVLSFSFKTYGFTISGDLTVEEDSAKIEGKIPIAAAMFKGKIQQSVGDELKKILS